MHDHRLIQPPKAAGGARAGWAPTGEGKKDSEQNHGIRLNPDKSKFVTFSKGDRIIVIAED